MILDKYEALKALADKEDLECLFYSSDTWIEVSKLFQPTIITVHDVIEGNTKIRRKLKKVEVQVFDEFKPKVGETVFFINTSGRLVKTKHSKIDEKPLLGYFKTREEALFMRDQLGKLRG